MSSYTWRLAGLLLIMGLAAALVAAKPAEAAAPKSKFEQAKLKATVIYRKYYWKQQDAALLGPEYKDLQEEAARLSQEWKTALDDVVNVDPRVLSAEEALRRARNKPENKRDEDEIGRRVEDVQIVRQNAGADIEGKINDNVMAVNADDPDEPAPAACGAVDQKKVVEMQNRIAIYEKRLAEAEQELKNINEAIRVSVKEEKFNDAVMNEKRAVFERRVKRLKHNLDEYKNELKALLNPPPCPPPSTSKQEDTPPKKPTRTTDKKKIETKQPETNETSTGVPAIAIDIGIGIGGGGSRREERRERDDRPRQSEKSGGGFGTSSGGGFGGGGGGVTFGR